MTVDIRYMLEHRLLPTYFFVHKKNFVDRITRNKDAVYNILDKLFKDNNLENIYKKEDFNAELGKVTDEVTLIKITFPKPEVEPLCYSAYIFYDKNFEKLGYYCIEKGNEGNNFTPYVASWTKEGRHENHGTCTLENNEDLLKCADLHMRKEYNMERKI